jgi:hypothetical protein
MTSFGKGERLDPGHEEVTRYNCRCLGAWRPAGGICHRLRLGSECLGCIDNSLIARRRWWQPDPQPNSRLNSDSDPNANAATADAASGRAHQGPAAAAATAATGPDLRGAGKSMGLQLLSR